MIIVLLTACYRKKIINQLFREIVDKLPKCICASLKMPELTIDNVKPYDVDVYTQDLRDREDFLSQFDLIFTILSDPLVSRKDCNFEEKVFEAEIEKIIPEGVSCSVIWNLYDGWTHTEHFESGKRQKTVLASIGD